jgi:hypothetical protein
VRVLGLTLALGASVSRSAIRHGPSRVPLTTLAVVDRPTRSIGSSIWLAGCGRKTMARDDRRGIAGATRRDADRGDAAVVAFIAALKTRTMVP